MSELSTTMAKLSGIRKALIAASKEKVGSVRSVDRTQMIFAPDEVGHYFTQAATHVETLKRLLPDLYGDFHRIRTEPEVEMAQLYGDSCRNRYAYARGMVG